MFQATKIIEQTCKEADLIYEVREGEGYSLVRLPFNGDSIKDASISFISEDDDNDFSMRSDVICTANEKNMIKLLSAVNELNNKFRFLKFVIDDDDDVTVEYDAPVCSQDVKCTFLELFNRSMRIMDEAYPILMKAMWG